MFRLKELQLHDCERHGINSGAELFVVEGESASKSVVRSRDVRTQAVLPMQGKPLNAIKASEKAVRRNELFCTLVQAVGAGWGDAIDLSGMRYERVILLFDPDADGIHCSALMMMFFHRWMHPMLESGRLHIVRAPLYEIASLDRSEVIHAFSEEHYQRLRTALDEQQIRFQGQRYRGLASMSEMALSKTCLAPATRNISPLGCGDAEAAIRIFMG